MKNDSPRKHAISSSLSCELFCHFLEFCSARTAKYSCRVTVVRHASRRHLYQWLTYLPIVTTVPYWMTQTVIQSELCRGGRGGGWEGGSPPNKNCLGGAASPPNSRMRGKRLVSPVDPSPLYREKVFEDSDSSWREKKKKTEIGCQVQQAVKDDNAPW